MEPSADAGEPKLGLAIAEEITEGIVVAGWPVGSIIASEAELLDRFGVSRAVVREAVRILEHRGVACMRRGRGGGLEVTVPRRDAVASAVDAFLTSRGVPVRESSKAADALRPAAEENPLLGLLVEALDRRRDDRTLSGKRGEQVAAEIREAIARAGWVPGSSLGSQAELIEHHGASRAVLREAIRILELDGVVTSRRGPGGGQFLRRPQTGAVTSAVQVIVTYEDLDRGHLGGARRSVDGAVAADLSNGALQMASAVLAELADATRRGPRASRRSGPPRHPGRRPRSSARPG